jgi:hypothetical protein
MAPLAHELVEVSKLLLLEIDCKDCIANSSS